MNPISQIRVMVSRPNRSCEKAIMKLLEYLNDGYEWIVDIDLEKFFDTVPQDRLMSLVHNAEVEVLESETNLEILLKGWKLVARNPRLRLLYQQIYWKFFQIRFGFLPLYLFL